MMDMRWLDWANCLLLQLVSLLPTYGDRVNITLENQGFESRVVVNVRQEPNGG